MKDYLEQLKAKLQSGNLDLSEAEGDIINYVPSLLKDYINAWSLSGNLWKKYKYEEDIDVFMVANHMPFDEKKYNFIKNIIFSNARLFHTLGLRTFNVYIASLEMPEEYAKKLKEEYKSEVLKGEYDFISEDADDETIEFLIENNAKDILANIDSFDKDETNKVAYEMYLDYCLKNGIKPAFAIVKSEDFDYNLKNYQKIIPHSVDNLLLLFDYFSSTVSLFPDYKQKFLDEIDALEKPIILKKESTKSITINNISMNYYDFVEELAEAFAHKGYPILLEKTNMLYGRKNDILTDYCFNNDVLDNYILEQNIEFVSDKKYFDRFLETGNLTILLDPCYRIFINDYIDEIVEKYKTNPKEQQELKKYRGIISSIPLAEKLAKEGYIEYMNLDYSNELKENEIKSLKNILTIYKVKPYLVKYKSIPESITKVLLECGFIDDVLSAVIHFDRDNALSFINKHKEEILEFFDKNPDIAIKNFKLYYPIFAVTDLMEYFKDLPDDIILFLVNNIISSNKINKIPKEGIEKLHKAFKKPICRLFNIDEKKLEIVTNNIGPSTLFFLDEDNIRELLSLDDETIEKITQLFKTTPITTKELEQAYLSLREYTFKTARTELAEIFTNMLSALRHDNGFSIYTYQKMLKSCFDEKLYDRLNKKYKLEEMGYDSSNYKEILDIIIKKIMIPEKQEKYTNILYDICCYYVEVKRAEYSDVKKMGEELGLKYTPEPKMLEEKIAKHIIQNQRLPEESVILENARDVFIKNGGSGLVYDEILTLLSGFGDAQNVPVSTKKQIKEVRKIIYDEVKRSGMEIDYAEKLMKSGVVEKVYNLNGQELLNPNYILREISMKRLLKIIADKPLYEKLVELFHKRKIHLLPKSINKILEDCTDIQYSEELIATLIAFSKELYKEEAKKEIRRKTELLSEINKNIKNSNNPNIKEKLLLAKEELEKEIDELKQGTLPDVKIASALADADSFSAVSSVFSMILTPEDTKLIKTNPSGNSATEKTKHNERLKESVELTKLLFTRDEITVPPIDETIGLAWDKKLRITLGNFTNPYNLTHGERTGACMRLGGVGEELFYFALKNKNGFHITIRNALTGEYVTRATGFRNGNTVFINEVRESTSEGFDDSDLSEAIKIFANLIIQKSKGSSYPIQNVIASNDCALFDEPTTNLSVSSITTNLGYVYHNIIPATCVVLATTAKREPFAPLDFNQEGLPIYRPIREQKREITTKKELEVLVNRVESVKAILNGADYQLLTPFYNKEDFIYAIGNDEWYIYVRSDGTIAKNCLSTDNRAQEEFLSELEKVEKEFAEKKEDENKWNLS